MLDQVFWSILAWTPLSLYTNCSCSSTCGHWHCWPNSLITYPVCVVTCQWCIFVLWYMFELSTINSSIYFFYRMQYQKRTCVLLFKLNSWHVLMKLVWTSTWPLIILTYYPVCNFWLDWDPGRLLGWLRSDFVDVLVIAYLNWFVQYVNTIPCSYTIGQQCVIT